MNFNTQHLSPEQSAAVSHLTDALKDRYSAISREELTLESVTTTNNKVLVRGDLTTAAIPKGELWIWNQSRGKQKCCCDDPSINVLFYKLNTKKARQYTIPPPPFKLWVFRVSFNNLDNEQYTFYWCEKGREELDQRLLADLRFLEPFVDASCAAEFGWSGFHIISNMKNVPLEVY